VENVNATMNEDGDMMEHLADDCAWEAKADLTEAAGGDLSAYMLAELNRAIQCEV
jgi:hypothetical protein